MLRLLAITTLLSTFVPAQAPTAEIAALQSQLTATRDAFVHETSAAGLTCTLPPPTIVIHSIPSFGNYDDDTNTITTPAWSQLPPEAVALFRQIAGPGASEEAVQKEFDTDAHHWVFIHELGHWTQHCRHLTANQYATELGANRIAGAYWRQHDPTLPPHMHAVFQGVVDHTPNPTPAGQDIEPYFNQNYEQLGPTPAYIWFQAHMCLTALDESPAPTFAQTILPPKS